MLSVSVRFPVYSSDSDSYNYHIMKETRLSFPISLSLVTLGQVEEEKDGRTWYNIFARGEFSCENLRNNVFALTRQNAL